MKQKVVPFLCLDCGFPLKHSLACACGYRGVRVDGIAILVPKGTAARWYDSDSLVRRLGRSWKALLQDRREEHFIHAALRAQPKQFCRRSPISGKELARARKLSRTATIRATRPPPWEPDEPIQWIAKTVRRQKPSRLLDMACGGGFLLEELCGYGCGNSVVALDRDFLCLKAAQTRSRIAKRNVLMCGADARRVPFADASFDCITSNFGFWHIEDFSVAVRECFRLLRPGGILVACEMDHGRLVAGLSEGQNHRLARHFGLYAEVPRLLSAIRRIGFKLLHQRARKAPQLAWTEILARKPLLPSLLALLALTAFTHAGENSPPSKDAAPVIHFSNCLASSPLGGICTRPSPWKPPLKPLDSLPMYDPRSENPWQLDLRGRDLSALSVQTRTADLLHASFDSETRFPKELPPGFDFREIMELGENPGLGVRHLHKQGITGRGIRIAVIDQNLLLEHEEYAGRIRSYEELHWPEKARESSMHAGAVVSIAVGKRCGVAPGAEVYYIADQFTDASMKPDFTSLASAVERVISFNKSVPKGKKIRVLAIQRGFSPGETGYETISAAIEHAKAEGIFVITSSLVRYYSYKFAGLGREPMSDPDSAASYGLGSFLLHRDSLSWLDENTLLVPMDSRTTAGPKGVEDYAFYREGGFSWAIPYLAGLYALACEVRPDITPDVFWREALDTGTLLTVKKDGRDFKVGKIVSPVRLVASLKKRLP
ncbi:MAG: methyltransferase domain-containing protein [Elusimicrobiota bacterium]